MAFSLLTTLGASGCQRAQSSTTASVPVGQAWLSPAQIKEANIDIAPVVPHEVGGSLATSGRITFDDLRVSHVSSPVSGRVTKILANPGERVKKDQPLCVIQSPDLGQAFSDLAKANADADATERDMHRQKSLYDAHAASQKDYEAAKAEADKAIAERERARRKAQLLGNGKGSSVTQEFVLRSPIEGEVVVRNVNLGSEVQGTYSGASAVELFTIGEIDHVWVLADLFEIDLGKVKQGSSASISVVSYADQLFPGVVDYVSGVLDPTTRTAKVRILVDNKARLLKPEMYAAVQISVEQTKMLAIPRTALLHLGDSIVVFRQVGTAHDGKLQFERRPVAVDEEQGGDFLPVTHGLVENDRIVASHATLLLGLL